MEMPGIEPGAFHMQSERATTALHPLSYRESFFIESNNLMQKSVHKETKSIVYTTFHEIVKRLPNSRCSFT